jgi:hypothetical protein
MRDRRPFIISQRVKFHYIILSKEWRRRDQRSKNGKAAASRSLLSVVDRYGVQVGCARFFYKTLAMPLPVLRVLHLLKRTSSEMALRERCRVSQEDASVER